MKAFEVPLISFEPWDDLEDIFTVSQEDTAGSADDYTTPPDEF